MDNRKQLNPVKNIIVRMPNFLGDSVMATPAIKLLLDNYPKARLTIVCKNPTQELFKNLPNLERLIVDNTKSGGSRFLKAIQLIREIRKEKYELGVLFQNGFTNALIFRFTRIKHLVGYRNDFRGFLLDYSMRLDRSCHYVNRFAGLVNSYLSDKYKKLPSLQLWSVGATPDFDFEFNLPVVALSLGSDVQGNRAYPREHSRRLVELLVNSKKYNLVFVGDKNDAIRNDAYFELLSSEEKMYVRNYSGKTDVGTHINLIKSADCLITVDSSGMHIAAACETPFIVILGRSTSPFSTVQPKVNFGRYIKNENDLINDDEFISQIPPEQIVEEIASVLDSNSSIVTSKETEREA